MEIKKAVRHAVPQIISLTGLSGSGKTYSALLLAAGLAGPGDKVGFIDTENGRGCVYSDSPGIVAAMPQGYDVIELGPPFHPKRYIEAIDTFENAGYKVLVIDSASHAWNGEGGCQDIAEKDKGRWANAKLANKKLVNRLLNSSMHCVVCLRAQDKNKIVKDAQGKEQTINLGILPISEKGFPFEFLLSFFMEEETKNAKPIKCPEPLMKLFPRDHSKRLTKADGVAIREWNETGTSADSADRLQKRARAAAEDGLAVYVKFFKETISPAERKILSETSHAANKAIAEQVDHERAAALSEEAAEAGRGDYGEVKSESGFAAHLAQKNAAAVAAGEPPYGEEDIERMRLAYFGEPVGAKA